MTLHQTVTGANNKIIPERIDENNSVGSAYGFTEKTIMGRYIFADSKSHKISPESGDQDWLHNIYDGVEGQELLLKASEENQIIVTEVGNIRLASGTTFALTSPGWFGYTGGQLLELVYFEDIWYELGRRE